MTGTPDIGAETLRRMRTVSRYNDWIIERIRPWLGDRVLEVGAGTGTFSHFFLNREHLVLTDIREDYLTTLRETYGDSPNVAVERYDLEGPGDHLHDHGIDTVVCLNVLEHIKDDIGALRSFTELLAPGGRVILQLPAHPLLYGSLDVGLDHFRRYTKHDIRSKFAAVGLETVYTGRMNLFGALGWFVNARMLKRDLLPEGSLGLFNMLTPLFMGMERVIPPPVGLSIIAVGQNAVSDQL
jgi:SAM-dependent methyltransferase